MTEPLTPEEGLEWQRRYHAAKRDLGGRLLVAEARANAAEKKLAEIEAARDEWKRLSEELMEKLRAAARIAHTAFDALDHDERKGNA